MRFLLLLFIVSSLSLSSPDEITLSSLSLCLSTHRAEEPPGTETLSSRESHQTLAGLVNNIRVRTGNTSIPVAFQEEIDEMGGIRPAKKRKRTTTA